MLSKHHTHFPSVEGFVRQLIGWREFMRGMYHTHDLRGNFFDHHRKLNDHWYKGTTGVPPLDDSILRVERHGYTHHIERLMVLGNIMLLSEIHLMKCTAGSWKCSLTRRIGSWNLMCTYEPVCRWWHLCYQALHRRANYIAKMSNYTKSGDWADEIDGLYWRFIDRNRSVFAATSGCR